MRPKRGLEARDRWTIVLLSSVMTSPTRQGVRDRVARPMVVATQRG